jgi:hypothetical protein
VTSKFGSLAAKVGSKRLAGWITQHNPKVRARAQATERRHKKTSLARRAK